MKLFENISKHDIEIVGQIYIWDALKAFVEKVFQQKLWNRFVSLRVVGKWFKNKKSRKAGVKSSGTLSSNRATKWQIRFNGNKYLAVQHWGKDSSFHIYTDGV